MIQLDHQTRKNIVQKHIRDYDSIGFNDLCEGLGEDPKTSMSRNTIAKILNELITEGKVAKKINGKQRFALTANVHEVRIEQKNLKKFDRLISKFETKFKKLSKLIANHNLYSVDKVTLLRRFAKAFWFLDFELYMLDEISTEKERQQRIQRLNKLKNNFFKLSWNDSKDKEVYKMLLEDLKDASRDYELDFDAEFEDWI